MGIFQSRPKPSPRIETDLVVAISHINDNNMIRPAVPEVVLRFDAVLDLGVIRSALNKLVTRGGWRKLGARIRMNRYGKLEYHVPEQYTVERPGVHFTEAKLDIKIEDHPLASKLPRAQDSTEPIFVGDPAQFNSLLHGPEAPTNLDGWLYSDLPMVCYHAVCFEDATLFTITWNHCVMDAMGLSAILHAVAAIVNGKEESIPEFLGFDSDPLFTLGLTGEPKSHILYDSLMTGLGSIQFGINIAIDLLLHRNDTTRVVCIPKAYFQKLYQGARADLNQKADLQEHRELPWLKNSPAERFVSESDVLTSWWTRMLVKGFNPRSKDTPVTIMNVFDFRKLIEPDILAEGGVYVGNATNAIFTTLPVWQVLEAPLSFLASSLRRSLSTQRTRAQLDAATAIQRPMLEKTGYGPMFGSPNMYILVVSNWHRGRLYDVDFSGAIIDIATRGKPLAGKPSYIQSNAYFSGFTIRNVTAVSGRDHDGNWWLSGRTDPATWKRIEEQLQG